MRLFYKALIVSIFLTLGLVGCKTSNHQEIINPEERGQFKLVLSDYVTVSNSSSKADPVHKPWESALKSLHLYAVKRAGAGEAASDPCAYYHEFSANELLKGISVFSIPGDDNFEKEFDFYVIANTKVTVPTVLATTTRATIEALVEQNRLSDYNSADNFSGMTDATGSFFVDKGGFAMSGKTMKKTAAKDDTAPTNVVVALNRLVAKLEVNCAITDAFRLKYGATGHGGTFTITSLEVTNVPNQGNVMPVAMAAPATELDNKLTQSSIYDQTAGSCKGLFYLYENGTTATSAITKVPRLIIRATYELAGTPMINVTYDNSVMDLVGESVAKKGLFLRNARYTVDVKINGLTPSEVYAEITVSDWAVAVNQDIVFGS